MIGKAIVLALAFTGASLFIGAMLGIELRAWRKHERALRRATRHERIKTPRTTPIA